jgi:hypothetical protein
MVHVKTGRIVSSKNKTGQLYLPQRYSLIRGQEDRGTLKHQRRLRKSNRIPRRPHLCNCGYRYDFCVWITIVTLWVSRETRGRFKAWPSPEGTKGTKSSNKYTLVLGQVLMDTKPCQSCLEFNYCFKRRTNVPPLLVHGVILPPGRSRVKIGNLCWYQCL